MMAAWNRDRMTNPYESPPDTAIRSPQGAWRKRFRWLCLGSLIVAVVTYVGGNVLELWMTRDASRAFILIRALIALIGLSSMAATGLFGIGWAVAPRPVLRRSTI